MSKFTKELVDDYAEKLLIGLTPEENSLVLNEFDVIDNNMELITKIPNIKEVEPMFYPLDNFEYILRDDVAEESVPIENLLQNCACVEEREIAVPRVVGGDE